MDWGAGREQRCNRESAYRGRKQLLIRVRSPLLGAPDDFRESKRDLHRASLDTPKLQCESCASIRKLQAGRSGKVMLAWTRNLSSTRVTGTTMGSASAPNPNLSRTGMPDGLTTTTDFAPKPWATFAFVEKAQTEIISKDVKL